MKFDVVIVGAGPAGLFAARRLENDFKVALVERRSSIGTYGNRIVNREVFRKLGVGDDCVVSPIEKIDFVSPSGIKISVGGSRRGFVVSKQKVQADMFEQLQNTSVFLSTAVEGIDFEGRCARTENGKFCYDTLLGADGTGSLVRSLVTKERPRMVNCHYGIYRRGEEETSCIISNSRAPGFYGWSIDMGDRVEIGMGASEEFGTDFGGFVNGFFPSTGKVLLRNGGILAKTAIGRRVFGDCILIGDSTGGEPLMGSSIHKSIDEAGIASDVLLGGKDKELHEKLWEERFSEEFMREKAIRDRMEAMQDHEVDDFFQKKRDLRSKGLVTGLLKNLLDG